MPYIKTQSGINWHYKAKGRGGVIVFIHGWSFDSGIWLRQTSEFDRYRIITLDLPGHGKSEYKKYTDIVKDLHFIFNKLGLSKVNIIGHSFGGLVGLNFVLKYPELLEKVIFIGTNAKFVSCPQYPFGLSENEVNKLRGFISSNYPEILLVFMRWLFTKEERGSNDFREIWNLVSKRTTWPDKEALGEFLDIIEKEDLRSKLSKINLPTLIISGSNDPICPIGVADYLNKQIKHSKVELFDNCGHLPFLTKPQRFNRLVNEFLAQ
jgi:pimeloyl-ACP methyl ester esterase